VVDRLLLGCDHSQSRRIMYAHGGVIAFATSPSIIVYQTSFAAAGEAIAVDLHPLRSISTSALLRRVEQSRACRMRAQYCAVTLLVANVGT